MTVARVGYTVPHQNRSGIQSHEVSECAIVEHEKKRRRKKKEKKKKKLDRGLGGF